MSTDLRKVRRHSKKIFIISLTAILLMMSAGYGVKSVTNLKGDLTDKKVQLQNSRSEIEKLNQQIEKAEKDKNSSQQEIQKLKQEKEDLKQQLQAKLEEKSRLAAAAAKLAQAITPVAYAEGNPSECGDNSYARYIYMHESSCSTTVQNAEGCLGIGQACPASKLTAVCPNLDYACQNQFFTDYANSRYGGWASAYEVWLNQHWW